MKKAFLIMIFMVSAISCKSSEALKEHTLADLMPFGVCYAKVSPEQVRNYGMVIIEPDFYSPAEIRELKVTGTEVLGYFTLGEVDPNRWYYPVLEQQGFLGVNPNWGSAFLDLDNEETRKILLDKVLPEIMAKGVDGIFLDTVDAVSPYTERSYLQPQMAMLIQGIRERYPDTKIIQNAGLFLLDKTRPFIDAVLIEDIASGYNFDENRYYIKDDALYEVRAELLTGTRTTFDIPVFVIDFAENEAQRERIRSRLDTLNVPYFISNIQLSSLPEDPSEITNRVRKTEGKH